MSSAILLVCIFVLTLLTSDVSGQQCPCPVAIPDPGCDVQAEIIPVELSQLVGPSCIRISYPQVVVNANNATFNDKATCIKYYLSTVENGCHLGEFKQSSRLVSTGEYAEERCTVKQLCPGVFEFTCPRINTVYYEHIHYFDGPNVISTTCLHVNGTFVDQMSVYMSTDRICNLDVIKQRFCDVYINVTSAEVLQQPYCYN